MSFQFYRYCIHKYVILTILLSSFNLIFAQLPDTAITDTSSTEKLIPINTPTKEKIIISQEHSPYKASLYSAVIPGLGQIYNKKYWKAPIIYVAFGTLVYYTWQMNFYYNEYRKAYADYYPDNVFDENYNLLGFSPYLNEIEQLKKGIEDFRRVRDLDVIIMTGLYFLNIIDANVDAQFFDYDVSNNLTLKIKPIYTAFNNNSVKLGLKLSILF